MRGAEFDGSARVSARICRSTARPPTPTASTSRSPTRRRRSRTPAGRRSRTSRAPSCRASRSGRSRSAASTASPRRSSAGPGSFFGAVDTSYRSSFSSSATVLEVSGRRRLLRCSTPASASARPDGWTVIAVVAQPAEQGLLRAAHRGAGQHRPLRRAARRSTDGRRDVEGGVEGAQLEFRIQNSGVRIRNTFFCGRRLERRHEKSILNSEFCLTPNRSASTPIRRSASSTTRSLANL